MGFTIGVHFGFSWLDVLGKHTHYNVRARFEVVDPSAGLPAAGSIGRKGMPIPPRPTRESVTNCNANGSFGLHLVLLGEGEGTSL